MSPRAAAPKTPKQERIRGVRGVTQLARAEIAQRRDLTFKHNQGLGRHGLLRLTPAYSLRLVQEVLARSAPTVGVLDPFCGTGTTPLAAASLGFQSQACDVNPFLVWFAGIKTRRLGPRSLKQLEPACEQLVSRLSRPTGPSSSLPPLHAIQRWWEPPRLHLLARIRGEIDEIAPRRSLVRDCFELALCRTLIRLSNAAFNHPSMSFSSAGATPRAGAAKPRVAAADLRCFVEDLAAVRDALADSPRLSATILHADARRLDGVAHGSFDRVVTSPPYANRMSYVRELRPYMYWLGYLRESREAGELDWQAIGGTWGIATSRLKQWEPGPCYQPRSLQRAAREIRRSGAPNAELLARYVERYFEDAWQHLGAVLDRIARPGTLHYIVGNSTFYGALVPTERIYAEMLSELGCGGVRVDTLRKRNSKRELYEFEVAAGASR